MEFDKYILRKKWWQTGSYSIEDGYGHFICNSRRIGFLKPRLELIDLNNTCFMRIQARSMGSLDHYFETVNGLVGTFTGSWSGQKFVFHPIEGDTISIKVNGWNNKVEFYSANEQIGIASANSYYSEIGCAINLKLEPVVMIACLVLIGTLKTEGYC